MKALLLIDIQNDFLPGGALAVMGGNEVVPVANPLMPEYNLIVATQDWHPADHQSFVSQHPGKSVGNVIDVEGLDQVLWPDHCVQGTPGAEFAAGLNTAGIHQVIQKGTDRSIDSYSGFFDTARRKATGLNAYLRRKGVNEVHAMGLATDDGGTDRESARARCPSRLRTPCPRSMGLRSLPQRPECGRRTVRERSVA